MKWMVVMKGEGDGCDYTIGCNMRFDIREFSDEMEFPEVQRRVIEDALERSEPCAVELFVVSMFHVFDLTADMKHTRAEADRKTIEEENKQKEEKERAKLAELKAKYGG